MYQCQACFNYQEELLDLGNGCGQVPCFCFSPEELMVQHLARQSIVDLPDDAELEDGMMTLDISILTQATDVMDDEDVDFVAEPVIKPEESVVMEEEQREENVLSMDGFNREILEDYNSQLYEFAVAVRYDAINQLHREIFERYNSQLCKFAYTDKSE